MDGWYRCAAVAKTGEGRYGQNLRLTVLEDVKTLELFPPMGPPVTSDKEQPVNVSEGKYDVSCRSSGFNSYSAYVILRFDNDTLIKKAGIKSSTRNQTLSREVGAFRKSKDLDSGSGPGDDPRCSGTCCQSRPLFLKLEGETGLRLLMPLPPAPVPVVGGEGRESPGQPTSTQPQVFEASEMTDTSNAMSDESRHYNVSCVLCYVVLLHSIEFLR
ncbi:uncharacterized protein [Littorina saxatilis]